MQLVVFDDPESGLGSQNREKKMLFIFCLVAACATTIVRAESLMQTELESSSSGTRAAARRQSVPFCLFFFFSFFSSFSFLEATFSASGLLMTVRQHPLRVRTCPGARSEGR